MKKLLFFSLACLTLAGCGVKPSTVEGEGDRRTYPDTSLDPAPRGGPGVVIQ